MQHSVGRMELLIEDILSLLRLQEITQELLPVDLNKVLDKSIEDLENQVTGAGAKIIPDHLPVIMGLPSSLYYLFNNIMGNAIKFRQKDRPVIIRITAKKVLGSETGFPQANQNNTYLQLTFSDNGIGFEEKYSKVIFQMFQRLNGKAEYAGTGIGLTICKKIMESHNGFIAACSEPGIGSDFLCYFPL
jgi:signal transduction histidine kinase